MIKFTKSGDKVEIVSSINDTQHIVKKIYVDSKGNEFPQGNQYVTSEELFDVYPCTTLKYNQLKNLNDKYEKEKQKLENDIKSLNNQSYCVETKMKSLETISKTLNESTFKLLCYVVSGKITHYVKLSWNPTIVPFLKETCNYNNSKLKLLTLYGSSNGNLTWKLSNYSDGSGSSYECIPCSSYEEAVSVLTDYVNSQENINEYILKECKIHNITISEALLKSYYESKAESIKINISNLQEQIQNYIESLNFIPPEFIQKE